jgi:hypothetical protein
MSGQKPESVPPAQIEAAFIQASTMSSEDIKDVLNMHEASLGMQSNEVSGKALRARQSVSELGSVVYFSNLNNAIEECGRVMNELIPYVYDTARTIRVLGEDDKDTLVKINQQDGDSIGVGKYAVTITTGPSYATKRVEAVESMMTLANSIPDIMGVAADKLVENMDWPGAEAIAERLRKALPPHMQDQEDMSDEQKAAAAQASQLAMQKQAIEMAKEQMSLDETETEILVKRAQAEESKARAKEALARAVKATADAEATETNRNIDIAKALDELDANARGGTNNDD